MSRMANVITGIRIVASAALLFCPALSPAFYTLYLLAGLSDMIDGTVARRTNSVSEFGSRFDSAADIVFVAVCLVKLLPVMAIPLWLYLWIAVIAVIKLLTIIVCFVRQGQLVAVHSLLNKLTGTLCFVLPLSLSFVDVKYSGTIVCTIATIAAVQEGYLVLHEKKG